VKAFLKEVPGRLAAYLLFIVSAEGNERTGLDVSKNQLAGLWAPSRDLTHFGADEPGKFIKGVGNGIFIS
jgi:hypothetical protein